MSKRVLRRTMLARSFPHRASLTLTLCPSFFLWLFLPLCLHSPDPPSPPLHPKLAEDSCVSEKASWPGWVLLDGCLFLGTVKKPPLASVSSVVKRGNVGHSAVDVKTVPSHPGGGLVRGYSILDLSHLCPHCLTSSRLLSI